MAYTEVAGPLGCLRDYVGAQAATHRQTAFMRDQTELLNSWGGSGRGLPAMLLQTKLPPVDQSHAETTNEDFDPTSPEDATNPRTLLSRAPAAIKQMAEDLYHDWFNHVTCAIRTRRSASLLSPNHHCSSHCIHVFTQPSLRAPLRPRFPPTIAACPTASTFSPNHHCSSNCVHVSPQPSLRAPLRPRFYPGVAASPVPIMPGSVCLLCLPGWRSDVGRVPVDVP